MGAAKQLYAKRSDLVNLDDAKDNTKIHLQNGESFTVFKGELIATDLDGNQMVIPQSQKHKYVPVDLEIEDLSPLRAKMAKGYMEMGNLNLEMSKAFHHAENEAETTTNSLVNGEYKEY
ncbi:hypothetical protein C3438_19600 [Bacillus velezensis]|uniref:hypothetical protein n=1 Tax=Bacillus amyloliquefaciens group TaxID=1938374 RepID=UPI000CE01513|nr:MULTISPECIES: hypothetical protein [Bacillus amyloliquefaciens group]AVB11531.1 hypothetical protein C3438_19600 [Bacillus velezensis]MCR6614555.1 hypothetical protein [Bacillus amyloliquefaciens]WBY47631.1 hypothetical protein PF996_09540 [Bacillus velezensis]